MTVFHFIGSLSVLEIIIWQSIRTGVKIEERNTYKEKRAHWRLSKLFKKGALGMGYVEELRKVVGHSPLILVGAVVVLVDPDGRLLLEKRKFPEGLWGLPGGLMELGESTEDTAKREVLEETGLTVSELRLINVYSGPNHFVVAKNGDEYYVVTTAYYSDVYSGELTVDHEESLSFKFFSPERLPAKLVGSHCTVIKEFLELQCSAEVSSK